MFPFASDTVELERAPKDVNSVKLVPKKVQRKTKSDIKKIALAAKIKVDKNRKKPQEVKARIQKKHTVSVSVKKPSIQPKTTVLAKEKKVISEKIKTTVSDLPKNSLAARKANKNAISREYYQIDDKEISDLLGKIEIKGKESVAITIGGMQGSGKTRFVFQLINAFSKKYKVGHASMEEHPESALYEDKALQYWSEKAINEVDAPEITSMAQLHKLIRDNDVIIIDSFAKMRKIDKLVSLDEDLRKKYDGKLFIVIYQLTTSKQMRGGSDSQFDADIVLFAEKEDDYKKNYIRIDKNRYNDRDDLKFNIYTQRIQKNTASPVQPKIKKLSFNVT
jgi:predicted ATP-dependent serine protease